MSIKTRKAARSVTALAAALVLAGCSISDSGNPRSFFDDSLSTNTTSGTAPQTEAPDTSSTGNNPFSINDLLNKSYSMTVNKNTGILDIFRADAKNTPMGDEGTWTIFVYMCASDLETGDDYYYGGSATNDINEMLDCVGSDKVRFVVETGGAAEWKNDFVSSDHNQIYLVQKGGYKLVRDLGNLNMGESSTLADFLRWGVENYASEHMGVVFWNHGGGSIDGVCFDELHEKDSLSLREIDSALLTIYNDMTDKFEFIGFDACLMSTVEAANIAATYADYMYASQEIESGKGWDYSAVHDFLAKNPGAGGAALGRKVADSYYESTKRAGEDYDATFSVIDLRKFDDFSKKFNDYCYNLYEKIKGGDGLNEVIRKIYLVDYFGGNSDYEGYFNMVDLGGVIRSGANMADPTEVMAALSECIGYNVNGPDHQYASGLSIYFPFHINGSEELPIFSDICVNPYYLSLIDLLRKGYSESGYDNGGIFDDDGYWYNAGEYGYDDDSGEYYAPDDYTDPSYGYWDSSDDQSDDTESELITFAVEPHIDENYNYTFTLDDNGYYYTADVTAYVYEQYDNGDILALGQTHNVKSDWSTGTFSDKFDGGWLSLPDGQNLVLYVSDTGPGYYCYISPIYFNDEFAYMKIRLTNDSIEIEGIFGPDSGTGSAARGCLQPQKGDIIRPYYDAFDADGNVISYEGQDYSYDPDKPLVYAVLEPGTYYYCFCITDIYGNYMTTELQTYLVDADGKVYYDNGSGEYDDYGYGWDSDEFWADYYWDDFDWDDWDDYDWSDLF